MQKLFERKGMLYIVGLFLIVCLAWRIDLVFAEEIGDVNVRMKDNNTQNIVDESMEKLTSLYFNSNYTDAGEQFVRIEERLGKLRDEWTEGTGKLNAEDDAIKELSFILSEHHVYIDDEEHLLRVEHQIEKYRQWKINYVGQ